MWKKQIQAAFGLSNYHMHQFEIYGERYGPSSPDDFNFGTEMIDESSVLLSQLIRKSGKRTKWMYEYDFGDGWRHEIVFEGYTLIDTKVKYPVCVEGERACPPEDVGGPWGYAEYLEAIADPDHERYLESLAAFDSEVPLKKLTDKICQSVQVGHRLTRGPQRNSKSLVGRINCAQDNITRRDYCFSASNYVFR